MYHTITANALYVDIKIEANMTVVGYAIVTCLYAIFPYHFHQPEIGAARVHQCSARPVTTGRVSLLLQPPGVQQ